jgi:hypothetical protein
MLVALGAVVGCIATAFACARMVGGTVADGVLARPLSPLVGRVAGALVGLLFDSLLRPRRLTRLAIVLLVINTGAWLLFVRMTPRLANDDDPVLHQRAEMDAEAAREWPNGMNMVSHTPSLLAGRRLTWVNLSEKPLGLTAGPAVALIQYMTVPDRYWQTGPTIAESYWVAAIAFPLSTAWWVAFALLLRRLEEVRR